MRTLPLAAAAILTASIAQAAVPPRHRAAAKPHATAASAQRPVDVGPFTPAANRAYQGGGVVLQGAPGAPAPIPQPTPPGQVPANSVQP